MEPSNNNQNCLELAAQAIEYARQESKWHFKFPGLITVVNSSFPVKRRWTEVMLLLLSVDTAKDINTDAKNQLPPWQDVINDVEKCYGEQTLFPAQLSFLYALVLSAQNRIAEALQAVNYGLAVHRNFEKPPKGYTRAVIADAISRASFMQAQLQNKLNQ